APRFAASGFEAEVVELLTTLQPNDASRAQVQAIARAVRRALGSALPGAAVEAFATANPVSGTAFGVAVPEVEVVVTLDAKATSGEGGKLQKSMIRTCTDRLVSQGSFKFRRSAFRGPEPKVTLIAPAEEGSIPFNLAVNATTPGRAALLFEASSL
ncbi:Ankrd17, partial [Symbiodinium sp. KB8]